MLFDFQSDYRQLISERLKELKGQGQALSLHEASQHIDVQYTYLSKVLKGNSKTHLGEDKLSRLCRYLQLNSDEEDYVFLLRSFEMSDDAQRKRRLFAKIKQFQEAHRLNVPHAEYNRAVLERETEYLLNPLAVVTHIGLDIPRFHRRVAELAPALGISPSKLQDTLRLLERHGLIKLTGDRKSVSEVLLNQSHLGLDHPLMRGHQLLLREFYSTRLSLCPDNKRKSFTALFTAEAETFDKVSRLFENFIQSVQGLSKKSRHENVFQLNFDFFPMLET